MAQDDIERRKQLTFKQAEGAAPLPSQLKREEISPAMAALLWEFIRPELENSVKFVSTTTGMSHKFVGNWYFILYHNHVIREHRFGDEFPSTDKVISEVRRKFISRDYLEVLDFLQFVMRHKNCPERFPIVINNIFTGQRSAYRVVDNDTFIPISSSEEESALKAAFSTTSEAKFAGTRAHLRNSVVAISDGKFADSVRESIHAVESVARTLEPTAKLSKALARLESSIRLHPSMKQGFASLYGYTSDEEGIRHPLLEAGDPAVDEADALFMLGACASFVTYLTTKVRTSGLATVPLPASD